jgi:hypothetical protein
MEIKGRFFRVFVTLMIAGLTFSDGASPLQEKSVRNLADNLDTVAPPDRKDVFSTGLMELASADARIRHSPDSLNPHLDRLRILFVLGVKEKEYLNRGNEEILFLKKALGKDEMAQNLLLGYSGAIRVVQAKHGLNLNRKWKNLEAGIPMLDSAVARDPVQTELRYLRLVSNYYLPFFLGRKPVVREDFSALAKLLPQAADQYPPKWFLNVARFVLEKGPLTEVEASRLKQTIQAVTAVIQNQGIVAREKG